MTTSNLHIDPEDYERVMRVLGEETKLLEDIRYKLEEKKLFMNQELLELEELKAQYQTQEELTRVLTSTVTYMKEILDTQENTDG